jgi:UDP-glucuronate 4-epimerase
VRFSEAERQMKVLVTGAAGFIGYHTASRLLARGDEVIGVDDLNAYYDVSLKEARLARLQQKPGFSFEKIDIAEHEAVASLFQRHSDIVRVVHLAGQAGVRFSLVNPYSYARANVTGSVALFEAVRRLSRLDHFVFASSSSVYGLNAKVPFAVTDRADSPASFYAATKKATEGTAHVYAHLFGLPTSGLRFFTVYGPWGRPDMAAYLFTRKILAGEPISVFNHGDMRRDFTYIDDIVDGVIGCLDKVPFDSALVPPFRLYNLGNNKAEKLLDFIAVLEEALGRKAQLDLRPMEPGDIRETYADISESTRDFGFQPKTTIREGIPRFVAWYREHYGV